MPKRIDSNHQSIVNGLRAVGCTILSLAPLGKGAPDILVGYRYRNYAFEIKDGGKSPSRRKLTNAEEEFYATWRGQLAIVTSLDDALRTIGVTQP